MGFFFSKEEVPVLYDLSNRSDILICILRRVDPLTARLVCKKAYNDNVIRERLKPILAMATCKKLKVAFTHHLCLGLQRWHVCVIRDGQKRKVLDETDYREVRILRNAKVVHVAIGNYDILRFSPMKTNIKITTSHWYGTEKFDYEDVNDACFTITVN